jgi:hypothetical protein
VSTPSYFGRGAVRNHFTFLVDGQHMAGGQAMRGAAVYRDHLVLADHRDTVDHRHDLAGNAWRRRTRNDVGAGGLHVFGEQQVAGDGFARGFDQHRAAHVADFIDPC